MTRRRPGGPPALSPEERDLWLRVTRGARPLSKPERARREAVKEAPAEADSAPRNVPKGTATSAPPSPPARTERPPQLPELAPGTVAGVDRRTAERLKRGQLPVEASLDLHGLTQVEAQRELAAFLAEAHAAGKRCVLVITGKGVTKEAGGVLRAQVPRWLNLPPNRARVLAFAYAQPRHGGHGALYVLLRRRRGE
ncbi:MAG: Smr/MutS family protein [Kiloniellaceae bacterium]